MATIPIPSRNTNGQIASSHIDLTIGSEFGRLTVKGNERRIGKNYIVDCLCDCGAVVSTRVSELKRGKKKQCGAHKRLVSDEQRKAISSRNRKHGKSRTPEYAAWIGMKMRCLNSSDRRYADYGGRGISVCAEWAVSFDAFLSYVGAKPSPNYSLDRIDVNGDYAPGNVRWADASTQMKNRRPFMVSPGSKRALKHQPEPHSYIVPPLLADRHHNAKHGMTNTPEYRAWRSMKKRCLNPADHAYQNYGGRGVTVHPAWIRDFTAFLYEIGLRPGPGYSLDRIDNSRGYEPGNVRWADASTQNRNRRPFLMAST